MSLFNAGWIGFDRAPITGKVPTKIVVHADGDMRLPESHRGAVAHAYKLFCDAVAGSAFPGGYHVQNRVLQDGTKIRMTSIASVHQVHVWPAGSPVPPNVVLRLNGVPASDSWRQGYSSAQSEVMPTAGYEYWQDYMSGDPPEKLTKLDLALPGHVTWSSPEFTVERNRVILAYRGPGSRYSPSPGFNDNLRCEHADSRGILTMSPPPLRNRTWDSLTPEPNEAKEYGRDAARTDSSYLWINGRVVQLPAGSFSWAPKVLAAAFHRPDTQDKGNVILRICTGHNPAGAYTGVNSTDFRIHVVDLKPVGYETTPAPLQAYLGATQFFVSATHVAANSRYSNTNLPSGTWAPMQRPHFDDNGSRLAMVVAETFTPEGGAQGNLIRHVGVSFNVPAWTRSATFSYEGTQTLNTTDTATITFTTHEGVWVQGEYQEYQLAPMVREETYNAVMTTAQTTERYFIYGVDFLNDVPVCLYIRYRTQVDATSTTSAAYGDTLPTAVNNEGVLTWSVDLLHSAHGLLATRGSSTTDASEGNISASIVADLNRDFIAAAFIRHSVGSAAEQAVYGVHVAGQTVGSATVASWGVNATNGTVISGGGRGTVGCIERFDSFYPYGEFAYGHPPPGSWPDYVTTSSNSTSSVVPAELYATSLFAPSVTRAVYTAVNRSGKAAYLAAAHYGAALSVLVRKRPEPDGPTHEVVVIPAYAPGVMSVLSTPFFTDITIPTP